MNGQPMRIVTLSDAQAAALIKAAEIRANVGADGQASRTALRGAVRRLQAAAPTRGLREWVAAELERRGMSENAFAAKAGISQPVLNRWLSGARDNITTATLEAILDTLARS